MSRGVVQKLFLKHQRLGTVADQPGRGLKRKTDHREDRKIIREIRKNPFVTIREMQEKLSLPISDRLATVYQQGQQGKVAQIRQASHE